MTVPEKLLIAVAVKKITGELPRNSRRIAVEDVPWKSLGYVVVDGIHRPFKPNVRFYHRRGSTWKFPLYTTRVCHLRPLGATSDYFDFLAVK